MLNRFGILAVCGVAALVGCSSSSSSASGDGDGGIVRDGDGSLITDDGGVWRDGDGSVIADDGGITSETDASLLDDGGVVNTALRIDTSVYLRTVILNAAPGRIVLNGLDLAPVTASNLTPAELAELGSMALSGSGSGETIGEETRKILAYAYSCALPASSSMQLEIGGETWEFQGALGLAPEWETGPCETECQEWVSACLLARTNQFGLPVALSLRGDHPALANVPAEVASEYSLREGSFYGNVFTATDSIVDHAYACAGGRGSAIWELTNRFCSGVSDGCPIKAEADCNIGEFACDPSNPGCSSRTACSNWGADDLPTTCYSESHICETPPTGKAYSRIITAYIKPPVVDCTNGICEEGETEVCASMGAPDCAGYWAERYGAGCDDDSGGMAVDAATGNISVAGRFYKEINFGSAQDKLTTDGDTDRDLFLASITTDQVHVWSKSLDSTGRRAMIRSVANDTSGNVVVAGHFDGTIDLGAGAVGDVNSTNLSYFVAKYARDTGAHLWSEILPGDEFHPQTSPEGLPAVKVVVDSNNGVTLATHFLGTIDLGLNGNGNPSAPTQFELLLVRFDASGALDWHQNLAGSENVRVGDLALDGNDNIILAGSFKISVTIGSSTFTRAPGNFDSFVAQFSSSGSLNWAKQLSGTLKDNAVTGIAVGSDDDILITGFYGGTVSIAGGAPHTSVLSSTVPSQDVFVAKLNSAGMIQWSRSYGARRTDVAYQAAWNGTDSYVVASVVSTDLGATMNVEGSVIEPGEEGDLVLIRYAPDGTALSVTQRGSPVREQPSGLVATDTGVILTGEFNGTMRFSGSYLTNKGGSSIFAPRDIFLSVIDSLQ